MSLFTQPALDKAKAALRIFVVNKLNMDFRDLLVDVDTTDITAAAHNYPSDDGFSMGGMKDVSATGSIEITNTETIDIEVEVMNDEDLTNGDWIPVYFYDDHNNTLTNKITLTGDGVGVTPQLFAFSLNNCNFSRVRFVLTASDADNVVILKARGKAL